MKTINLSEFAPIISDKETGKRIYDLIMAENPTQNKIEVDMSNIKSMATFCAKQIFGRLYVELKPSIFFTNIIIRHATNDIQLLIKLGIRYAVEDEKKSQDYN